MADTVETGALVLHHGTMNALQNAGDYSINIDSRLLVSLLKRSILYALKN